MKRDPVFWGWVAAALLILSCFLLCHKAEAAIRVNLLAKLNELMDDANNRKMSQANKIIFLDQVGREYGRLGLYIKRDTILTVAGTETYALASDFAGGLTSAYLKRKYTRVGLPVIDRDSSFKIVDVKEGDTKYLFVDEDAQLGVHGIPLKQDTIIVLYFAYPAALSGDSTEWDIPNHYEGAALDQTAGECLMKVGTAEAQAKAAGYLALAKAKLDDLRNPTSQTRRLGVTVR